LFFINIFKTTTKIGFGVSLVFQITQHTRDEKLMKSFISYLDCGRYTLRSNKVHADFLVTTFSDNYNKIIPFFKTNEILGTKAKDFADFCSIGEMIQAKTHLTSEGLEKIKLIKSSMNKDRID
jgi:LAGLIDADG endonuclease